MQIEFIKYDYKAAIWQPPPHNVTAAIVAFQNNEAVAFLVYQTNPVEVDLFSYVNTPFYVPLNLHGCPPREWKRSQSLGVV